MTVTLNGKTLDVLEFGEGADPVQSHWDAWQNSAYKREIKVYGVEETWRLACVEKDVAWADSQPKSFEEAAEAGDPVAFVVTDEERAANTSAYILAVSVHFANLAGKNIRYFTLTLQEV